MIEKKFSGFTKDQMQKIASSLGHDGPLEEFNTFLASSPEKAAKLSRLTEKARGFVEAPNMAAGGTVIATGGGYKEGTRATVGGIPSVMKNGQWVATGEPKKTTNTPAPKPTTKPAPKPAAPAKPKTAAQKAATPPTAKQATATAANTPTKAITPAKPTTITTNLKDQRLAGQTISDEGNTAATATAGPATQATAGQVTNTAQAATPQATEANTVDPALAGDQVNEVVDQTQAAQGTVSQDAQMQAATALPSADATVQGQLEKLMMQFDGNNTPPWAAGAKRMADTMMAQRGLGSSSMAVSATTQALMESAISIAVQDASTFSQFEMQNLNNRQQARLQNAQAFLQMDLANLNNRQQTEIFKSQARIQSLFTDQAATNAAAQFNATSQNQTDQFFAELKSQVSTFNAAQKNASALFNAQSKTQTSMFNAEQLNAVKMFDTEQKNAQAKFNATQRLVIDQANAKWRQEIATINNAQINETNRLNAQLASGLTTAAYNNIWQNERDLMAYAFTAAENANQRAAEITIAKMQGQNYKDVAKSQQQFSLGKAAGDLIGTIFDSAAENIIDSIF